MHTDIISRIVHQRNCLRNCFSVNNAQRLSRSSGRPQFFFGLITAQVMSYKSEPITMRKPKTTSSMCDQVFKASSMTSWQGNCMMFSCTTMCGLLCLMDSSSRTKNGTVGPERPCLSPNREQSLEKFKDVSQIWGDKTTHSSGWNHMTSLGADPHMGFGCNYVQCPLAALAGSRKQSPAFLLASFTPGCSKELAI